MTFEIVFLFIFANKNLIYNRKLKGQESHVNRTLNVWGSGGAHKTYFKKN